MVLVSLLLTLNIFQTWSGNLKTKLCGLHQSNRYKVNCTPQNLDFLCFSNYYTFREYENMSWLCKILQRMLFVTHNSWTLFKLSEKLKIFQFHTISESVWLQSIIIVKNIASWTFIHLPCFEIWKKKKWLALKCNWYDIINHKLTENLTGTNNMQCTE